MSTGDTWTLGRRPALDGLRGLAVLLVIAAHIFAPGMRDQGKTGVAIFFTLSGFLITSLLLREHTRTGRIALRRFYWRRFMRLAPAQVFCVSVIAPVGLLMGPVYLTEPQVLVSLFYLGNMVDPGALFAHFWSLAVEEQFYLLAAPALAGLLPRRRGVLVAIFGGGALAAFGARMALTDVDSLAAARSLPVQADALLVGCALAAWTVGRKEGLARPRLAAACVVVLVGMTAAPVQWAGSVGIFVAAVVTAVALHAVAHGESVRFLSGRWLTLVGRRSYALYLWHYPALVVAVAFGVGRDDWATLGLIVVPTAVLFASVSWAFVEAPCLRKRDRAGAPSVRPLVSATTP